MNLDPKELLHYVWSLIKPVWRLCLAICVIQLVGSTAGLIAQPIGFVPIDLWYGAAYASPFGFIVGAVWQSWFRPGSLRKNAFVVWFLAVASIALPLFGYLTMEIWQSEFAR